MGTLNLTPSMVRPEWFISTFKGKHLKDACEYLGVKDVDTLICKSDIATLVMRKDGNEHNKIPGVMGLAKNLVNTATDVACDGLKEADNQEERFAICLACPQYIGGDTDRCSVCGCYVAMKIRFAASHCPKGKW